MWDRLADRDASPMAWEWSSEHLKFFSPFLLGCFRWVDSSSGSAIWPQPGHPNIPQFQTRFCVIRWGWGRAFSKGEARPFDGENGDRLRES